MRLSPIPFVRQIHCHNVFANFLPALSTYLIKCNFGLYDYGAVCCMMKLLWNKKTYCSLTKRFNFKHLRKCTRTKRISRAKRARRVKVAQSQSRCFSLYLHWSVNISVFSLPHRYHRYQPSQTLQHKLRVVRSHFRLK